ncbi:hypothetical protein [Motilibacter rhizosphaerae]
MTYTADKPTVTPSPEELRERIPGWGVDLDPADRPAFPREVHQDTGAHWDFPERQEERWPRERSIEHGMLPPVFGTSCPPRGLSGAIRKYAYATYSEGRSAHWLLLLAADRVDALEGRLGSGAMVPPATGLRSELSAHGLASRRGRVDLHHQWLDPLVVAAPWAAGLAGAYAAARGVRRLVSR